MENNSTVLSTGFYIGFDFAFYRLNKPDTLSPEVVDGFYHKYDCGGSKRKPNLFVKKWLNLRLHAYERGVHFSEDLSIDQIKQAFTDSRGICPVTKEILTTGTLKDSDWSIDRVINDYGYVKSNIIVMSRRANDAKGNLSLSEVKSIRDSKSVKNGLTHIEWCNVFDIIWRFNEKYEFMDSNLLDELMDLNDGYDLKQFGLALLNKITEPRAELDDLALDLFIVECAQLPHRTHRQIRKEVIKLMTKRGNSVEKSTLGALMKRSSCARRKVDSILSLLTFEEAHNMYVEIKNGFAASVIESKTATRVSKNTRLSFSQRAK